MRFYRSMYLFFVQDVDNFHLADPWGNIFPRLFGGNKLSEIKITVKIYVAENIRVYHLNENE